MAKSKGSAEKDSKPDTSARNNLTMGRHEAESPNNTNGTVKPLDKETEKKYKQAAAFAFKKLMASMEHDPEVIVLTQSADPEPVAVDKITEWLFKRM